MISNGVNKVEQSGSRNYCGTGYVILSRNYDRETYVNICHRERTVSIITQDGEIIKNCIVVKNLFNDISFPETPKERGSCVAWLSVPFSHNVIVFDVIEKKDELNQINEENIFKFIRNSQRNKVQIKGEGNTGNLYITSQGEEDGEGQVYLRVLNSKQLGLLDALIQGNVNIQVEGEAEFKIGSKINIVITDEEKGTEKATFSYILGSGLEVADEFGNNATLNKNGIEINCVNGKNIIANQIGKSADFVMLANNTIDTLNKMLNIMTDMHDVLQKASSSGPYVITPQILINTVKWKKRAILLKNGLNKLKSETFKAS